MDELKRKLLQLKMERLQFSDSPPVVKIDVVLSEIERIQASEKASHTRFRPQYEHNVVQASKEAVQGF